MLKKGFFKIRLHSLQLLKNKVEVSNVKVTAVDTTLTASVPQKQMENQAQYLLPIADKIHIEVESKGEQIGYFELPIKKMYDYPTKRHIVSVSCITKNKSTNEVSPEVFANLKLSLMYFQNHIAKLDILVEKVEVENHQQKQIFLQCVVGNVSSQTTLKKITASNCQWKQILPFTLEFIPGKIQLILKEKDMINGEILGKISLNPQSEQIFLESNNKEPRTYEMADQKFKAVVHLSKLFKIPENQ